MVTKGETILQAENVNFRYPGGELVLKQLSLQLRARERTILLGPNGAGKSTLIFTLLGLNHPESGQILFQGKQLGELSEEILRQRLAYIFQNPDDQVFAPTVEEDVRFGLVQFGYSEDEQKKRVSEVAEWLKIEHLLKRNPRHLSYGEKRRVALAGVLVMEPEVIFFDEPLAFLDPPGRNLLLEILESLEKQGKTLFIATHDLNFAAEWGERFLVLENGCIGIDGDKSILRKGIEIFNYSVPIPTEIFRDIIEEAKLPVTVAEGRKLLKKSDVLNTPPLS